MATKAGLKEEGGRGEERRAARRVNKKDQILALFMSGIGEVEDLAMITGSRPSYVGSILQEAGLKPGYFDLYTSTSHPMNVYSKFFANKLGFKDEETARASLELIDRLYRQFEFAGDRAGQVLVPARRQPPQRHHKIGLYRTQRICQRCCVTTGEWW